MTAAFVFQIPKVFGCCVYKKTQAVVSTVVPGEMKTST